MCHCSLLWSLVCSSSSFILLIIWASWLKNIQGILAECFFRFLTNWFVLEFHIFRSLIYLVVCQQRAKLNEAAGIAFFMIEIAPYQWIIDNWQLTIDELGLKPLFLRRKNKINFLPFNPLTLRRGNCPLSIVHFQLFNAPIRWGFKPTFFG